MDEMADVLAVCISAWREDVQAKGGRRAAAQRSEEQKGDGETQEDREVRDGEAGEKEAEGATAEELESRGWRSREARVQQRPEEAAKAAEKAAEKVGGRTVLGRNRWGPVLRRRLATR